MNELEERHASFKRTIFAVALAQLIFGSPLLFTFIWSSFYGSQIPDVIIGFGFFSFIFLFCGLLFTGFTALHALTTFFRKPMLRFTGPIPKDILWSLTALAAAFLSLGGLWLQRILLPNYALYNGIDLLSGTIIFGSLGLYFAAIFKAIQFRRISKGSK